MSTLGTAQQLHQATGVPVRTIQRWAARGELRPVDRVRTGTRWADRYDGAQVMRLSVSRHRA